MQSLSLSFLWHMHQPYYRNMLTDECAQPWVRLHGIRSYYDMLKIHEEFGDIQTNINFVPCLLLQLRHYIEGRSADKFLTLTQVPSQELNSIQKTFILRNFFMANPERMIKPYPRYWKLFGQRGEDLNKVDLEDAIRYFSWQDYLDIQVYYNLVWFGFKAKEEIPEIENLLTRHHFTEDDKKFVIESQFKILNKLADLLKNVPKNVELTTTPFFHPILPLLLDTNHATRSMSKAILPQRFSAPKYAQFQLDFGLKYFEDETRLKPSGMWPAEGSVCPEMLPMLDAAGIKWIATDEDILKLSGVGGRRADFLYQPYLVDGNKVAVVFRDKELSNLIGFSYGKMPHQAAVDDLIGRLVAIGRDTRGKQAPLVTIVLDGENPWETYENGGKPFLTNLFSRFREMKIRTTTVSGYLAEHPPIQKLSHLHSGSWINANYAIWIGKPQKNQAWGYIKRTLDELGKKLDQALQNKDRTENELKAIESFGAACGSDWFWWFDDDFASEFKIDFDQIFRTHLKNAFIFLGRDIPVFLFHPIFKYEKDVSHRASPPAFSYPKIDGMNTSFFEWINAAKLNVGQLHGTMGQAEEIFETIYFAFNHHEFYLRIDPLDKNVTFHLDESEEIVFYVHDSLAKYKLRLFFEGGRYQMEYITPQEEGYARGEKHKLKWAVRAVFEIGFSFEDLGFKSGEEITLIITVVRKGIEVRRYSHIVFTVPDETYEGQMWSV